MTDEQRARDERDRSYRVRLNTGDRIRTRRDLIAATHGPDWTDWQRVTVPAGTELVNVAETNAGFRGIEFFAWYDHDGIRYHVIASTGAVDKVTTP